MRTSRVVLIALITLLLGFVGGYFFYANTVARYDVISSACVAMQEAVNKRMLTTEQVRDLGDATGRTLKQNYSSVANKLNMPEKGINNASEESICSQYLAGVNQSR